jgi:hypothetical protein
VAVEQRLNEALDTHGQLQGEADFEKIHMPVEARYHLRRRRDVRQIQSNNEAFPSVDFSQNPL